MKKIYLYGAMAMGLLFTGCSSDDLAAGPEGNKTDVDRTLYVNMNIRGDMGSRAASEDGKPVAEGDFDPGVNESNVKDAYFVFYDDKGNLVGEIVKITLTDPITENAGPTVEKYYQSVVPIAVYKGESDPSQVVCYINPVTPSSLQNPLDVIQTITRNILYTGEGTEKAFAMSNSVYYPKNAEAPQIAVPISNTQLFDTKQEALAALTAGSAEGIVDIYVERYASKLKFNKVDATTYTTATSPILDPTEVPVTLDFVPERWALNAACTSTYVVKSFRQENPDNNSILPGNYTFNELNSRINASSFSLNAEGKLQYDAILTTGLWDWNNYSYHRSFWGMSPAYFTSEYPEVSSDVKDIEDKYSLNQHYYSYNELLGVGDNAPKGFAHGDTDPHYFHETTVGAKALSSKNPAAATPSVILVGKYQLAVNGTALADETTFYTYLTGTNGNALVYFEAEKNNVNGTSAVAGGESMIRRFIEQASVIVKQVPNTDASSDQKFNYIGFDLSKATELQKLVAALELVDPSVKYKGQKGTNGEVMKFAERYRTLAFADDADTDDIYIATNDGYKKLISTGTTDGKNITIADANLILMQQVGYCVKYNTGAAYFNIPVKHYGWYRGANTQKNENEINWNLVRVGDFGMVRNHVYDINVTKITGLATGIGGLNNPIVPSGNTNDYFIAYRVNILKWAVVPQQNVEL